MHASVPIVRTCNFGLVRENFRDSGHLFFNNMCAKLQAAAQNWRKKVQETMATLGFSIGKASPVLFHHPQRGLKCLVHGDDFVVSGEPVDLVWMRNELESNLEINATMLGDGPGMAKEVKTWHCSMLHFISGLSKILAFAESF